MKDLIDLEFNVKKCREELKEFGELLQKYPTLSEQKTILPFFKKRKHLGAFIGFLHSYNVRLDRFATEFSFYGKFTCDLISGDSTTHSFCVVEFEDAKANSVFTKTARSNSYWARRFEGGFSQLVDWIWTISDFRNTRDFNDTFGNADADFIAVLVIGRKRFIKSPKDKRRFEWRGRNAYVNNIKVTCMTYDELYRAMCARIKTLSTDEENEFVRVDE